MRDESQNLMDFQAKSLGHPAGKDQGVVADFSWAVREPWAVHGLQSKCGDALSSDSMRGCRGNPLGGCVLSRCAGWGGGRCGCSIGWKPLLSCNPRSHQVFSTGGASRRLGQPGRVYLACQPAQVVTWPGVRLRAWHSSPTAYPRWLLAHCLGSRQITYSRRKGDERERRN